MDYSATVNLPKTTFSMKANLREKEPKILQEWTANDLYRKIIDNRSGSPSYVLHDGPPYANGEIHIGHALNKSLKDIVMKYRTMAGFSSVYVPGWDCHGLPIEHQVVKELKAKGKVYTTDILRKACRSFAEKFVKVQRKGFERLGVFGLWDEPYLTMSPDYEASIVGAFANLVEKGYVTRRLKPVHWCPSCETALAEAEVEYKDQVTPAVTVKFRAEGVGIKGKPLSVLIWTTTPWTLPANMAVCFHPKYRYLAVRPEGRDEYWIMVNELAEATLKKAGLKAAESVPFSRDDLAGLKLKHPFLDRDVRPVFDEYVTLDTGTGVVHIAPGHGEEDYAIGTRDGLTVISPVDAQGRFTDEFAPMKGVAVLEANEAIVALLKEKSALVADEKFSHSYPHCWRCKHPVIFRATRQWFLSVDHDGLRQKAVKAAESVTWVPGWGQERMTNMLEKRPDWCLSRQRAWGVPIPAFTCSSCDETLMTPATIRHFADLASKRNIDIWFTESAESLLPAGAACPKCGRKDFVKSTDILDVWFDSGVSHFAVLEKRNGLSSPADLYLEGSDQYRGWFQSSLLPSVALRGRPPYKTVLTHGFLLDEQGHAMHKSAGNAIPPSEIVDEYGADILRLWVVSQDYREDIALGKEMLKRLADSYRMVRNTIRYLLGNLNGFDPAKDSVAEADLESFDRWALAKHRTVVSRVRTAYESFQFNAVFHELVNYCSSDLSASYFNILKDRLYTAPLSSKEGRSARTVLVRIFGDLVKMVAPVLVFTAEEAWATYRNEIDKAVKQSVHLEDFPAAADEPADAGENAKLWDDLLALKPSVQKALEIVRNEKLIGDPLEACVVLKPKDEKVAALVKGMERELAMLLIVSEVRISDELDGVTHEDGLVAVQVLKSEGEKCPRCWKRNVKGPTDPARPELCPACAAGLAGKETA
jgi:isoleucyl-tRNA synthetase